MELALQHNLDSVESIELANEQQFFRAVFGTAAAISVACYCSIPILLLLPTPPNGAVVAGIAAVILAPFLLVGLILRGVSDGELCLPCTAAAHKFATWLIILIFIVWFAGGILCWPAAPLRQVSNSFLDKRGKVYSRTSYDAFRKWEATLPLAWLPFALVAITALPATDRNRHLHYCE